MSFDRIRAMQVFTRVVELGGFTAAARDLGLSQPAVTKSIKALEDHLGAQLLNRSTRAVALSDEGQIYYDDAVALLETLSEAEARVGKRAAAPSGQLRIACAVAFGRIVMVPVVKRFLAENPQVTVELVMADRMIDMVEEGIDVSIRIGELADSTLRARRIGTALRATLATPGYLARRGVPETAADLSGHDCIVFTGLSSRDMWHYQGPQGPTKVRVAGPFSCTGSEGARSAILADMGIGYHPEWLFAEELANGSVVRLLEQYRPPPMPIHAVFPAGRYLAAKTRALIECAERCFAEQPELRR